MRKNIYDVLRGAQIDISREYNRLLEVLYRKPLVSHGLTLRQLIEKYFDSLENGLIGRCISLNEFEMTYGYNFLRVDNGKETIDDLLDISEYTLNFIAALRSLNDTPDFYLDRLMRVSDNIKTCMEDIGYKLLTKDGLILCVENKPEAVAVAETVDESWSYSVLFYNHHRMKGDLEAKKSILLKMANDIEPDRKKLKSINANFESVFFQLLNKFVRHNNDSNSYINDMKNDDLEKVYDEIYQMWLLAKLQLNYQEHTDYVQQIIAKLNNN